MATPIRYRPRGGGAESTLRSLAMLAAVLFAIHSLWPVWAPNTPRPWGALLNAAGQAVRLKTEPAVDQHFSGCNEARAAGRSNIPASDPSYRPWMDGDGDGWACEPYRR